MFLQCVRKSQAVTCCVCILRHIAKYSPQLPAEKRLIRPKHPPPLPPPSLTDPPPDRLEQTHAVEVACRRLLHRAPQNERDGCCGTLCGASSGIHGTLFLPGTPASKWQPHWTLVHQAVPAAASNPRTPHPPPPLRLLRDGQACRLPPPPPPPPLAAASVPLPKRLALATKLFVSRCLLLVSHKTLSNCRLFTRGCHQQQFELDLHMSVSVSVSLSVSVCVCARLFLCGAFVGMHVTLGAQRKNDC